MVGYAPAVIIAPGRSREGYSTVSRYSSGTSRADKKKQKITFPQPTTGLFSQLNNSLPKCIHEFNIAQIKNTESLQILQCSSNPSKQRIHSHKPLQVSNSQHVATDLEVLSQDEGLETSTLLPAVTSYLLKISLPSKLNQDMLEWDLEYENAVLRAI